MSAGRRSGALLGTLMGLAVAMAPDVALANGQSTHLWISHEAIGQVPPGPLADFVASEALRKMLDNGTMFPDGGYPLGDPYAEIAHWEPFQIAYFEWILANYAPPYTDEGARHLAFMLGLASHGMADQVFDSMYGERVKVYDGAIGDFDTASDLILMSNFPPMTASSEWVPFDVLDGIYDGVGFDADPATMMEGQNLLRIAVNAVSIFSQMPDKVSEAAAPFPWGSVHLLDHEVEGSPPIEAEIVARYWRVLWALAHGQPLPGPVLASLPPDGGANHPTDSSSIESYVSVVFSRGLEQDLLVPASFHLVSEGGDVIDVTLWHYYGQSSHVVHLRPQQDLAADTIYTVTIDPGVQSIHGEQLDGYSFRFSTGPQGPDPIVPEWPADHDPSPDPGDGDGDGDGAPGDGDGDGAPGDGDGDPGSTDGGGTTSSSGGELPADEGGSCGCTTPQRGPAGMLLLIGLGMLRPRRRICGTKM